MKNSSISASTFVGADSLSLDFAQRKDDRISAQGISFCGLVGFFFAWWIMKHYQWAPTPFLLVFFLFFTALPMVVASIWINQTYRRSSTGLRVRAASFKASRIRIKVIGFLSTLVALLVLYWLFPLYSGAFYQPVWQVLALMTFLFWIPGFAYLIWIDRRMLDPEDGYYHFGLLILGRISEVSKNKLKDHAMGWAVKGFFLPLMLAGSAEHLQFLSLHGVNFESFGLLYSTLLSLILLLDLTYGVIGYLLTLRVTDSHIRSTEQTWQGWLITIICYAPFSTFIWASYLKYKGPIAWHEWLAANPVLFITWGFAILLLHVFYLWATLSFGCRFSNLTHRGIIVDGPYRYLKHPAYVAKCSAWWLMSVPFVAHGTASECLRASLCLLLTCGIYALRAWTEERHLSRDPAYRAYLAWIQEHGLCSLICRRLKALAS
jgi:isoprenylcysteine carboxyl methyltransferase (ICMT) family protein YpbQ